jgi:type II secretory pathway pseudopilin PulG
MTLLETLVVVILVGILAAIGVPNLMQMMNNQKVKTALEIVQGVLEDSQRQAMRQSKNCSITLNPSNNPPNLTTTGTGCMVTSDSKLPTGIAMTTNLSSITFSFKGTTTSSGTIVVESSDGPSEKRCLVISNGLGIMRTGIYTGSTSGTLSATNCNTSL